MPVAENLKKVYEIVMQGNVAAGGSNATPVNNVFHFRRTGVTVNVSKGNMSAAFKAAIGDIICAAYSLRYTQADVTIRCVDDSTDLATSFAVTTAGAVTGDSLPVDQMVSMNLRTGTRGVRGGKRYGPIAESSTTGEVLNTAGLLLWNAVQTAHLAGFTDASGNVWVPVVLSKEQSELTNPTTIVTFDVTQIVLAKDIRTLKRRKVLPVF